MKTDRHVIYNELLETVKLLRDQTIRTGPRKFYASGSGFTDEFIVDYFKGTGTIVVTRDGTEWLNGMPVSTT